MKLSALSHAGVAVVSSVLGSLLIEYIKPAFPGIHRFLENIGFGISNFVNTVFNVRIDPVVFTPFFVMILIGTGWGILYGLARHRKND